MGGGEGGVYYASNLISSSLFTLLHPHQLSPASGTLNLLYPLPQMLFPSDMPKICCFLTFLESLFNCYPPSLD